jgi:hypothetical protein
MRKENTNMNTNTNTNTNLVVIGNVRPSEDKSSSDFLCKVVMVS